MWRLPALSALRAVSYSVATRAISGFVRGVLFAGRDLSLRGRAFVMNWSESDRKVRRCSSARYSLFSGTATVYRKVSCRSVDIRGYAIGL